VLYQFAQHMPICTAHAMQLVKAGSGCSSVGSVYCSVFLDADPDKVWSAILNEL